MNRGYAEETTTQTSFATKEDETMCLRAWRADDMRIMVRKSVLCSSIRPAHELLRHKSHYAVIHRGTRLPDAEAEISFSADKIDRPSACAHTREEENLECVRDGTSKGG